MIRDHEDYDAMLFGIQRSVRYHDRRVAHFDLLHKVTDVLTILLSGVVILELSGVESPTWIKILATVTAILVASDLVVGYSRRANQHHDFKRRFIELERRMLKSDLNETFDAVRDARLVIESEEPPIFRALDAMCHNELLTAKGFSRVASTSQTFGCSLSTCA